MSSNVKSQRESNFELLRIVSMIAIVICHMANNNDYLITESTSLMSNFIHSFFSSGGQLGVICFVLITGYFMVNSKIKIRKIILLELQVLFYSYMFLFLASFLGMDISMKMILRSIFPNIMKSHWFFSSYFILYLFIPFLNKLISSMSKKEYHQLLLLGFVFLILIPSLVIYNKSITMGIYLFYYYMVGAYIRLYGKSFRGKYKFLFGFCFSYFMIVVLTLFIKFLSISNVELVDHIYFFTKINSILMMVSALSLFLFFLNLKIGYNKIINFFASCSFGVYIFHDNLFMAQILWKDLFVVSPVINTGSYLWFGMIVGVLIYLMGSCIDFIRQKLFFVVECWLIRFYDFCNKKYN